MSTFKPLKKGDLVVAVEDSTDKPSYVVSLNDRGFILGEVERGSKYGWGHCKIHVILQAKDYFNQSWTTTIAASKLHKVELYKVKKKGGKRKAIPTNI